MARLLVVTNDFPPRPGGIQQYLGNLVEVYPDDVLVLAPSDPAAGPGDPGVRRHRARFMWPGPAVERWVRTHVEQFEPDLVLFGAPTPLSSMGARLRKSTGVPFAVLCHGAEINVASAVPVLRRSLVRALGDADAVFAVSHYTARKVGRLSGRPATYLGAGVDLDVFRPDGPARPDRRRLVVGCVSRFVPRKGQHRLIEAAAVLAGRGRDLELLFVGKGRKERDLLALAKRLAVPVRFEIDVPWGRLPDLYRGMDIFCMPARSRWFGVESEGLGLVYLEAAACGLPVVSGTSGGSPETVVPGETGYVADSVADVVQAIELLCSDPDRARAMGVAGRHNVERHHRWDLVAKRLVNALPSG